MASGIIANDFVAGKLVQSLAANFPVIIVFLSSLNLNVVVKSDVSMTSIQILQQFDDGGASVDPSPDNVDFVVKVSAASLRKYDAIDDSQTDDVSALGHELGHVILAAIGQAFANGGLDSNEDEPFERAIENWIRSWDGLPPATHRPHSR